MDKHFFEFLLRMGDTTLILSQRLGEWTGHGPILEEDLALTNTALDLLGQARMWLTLAGEVEGAGRDEDALAYLRDAHQFHNALLVERANGNYADTMARQFLFDVWHYFLLQKLAVRRRTRRGDRCQGAQGSHLSRAPFVGHGGAPGRRHGRKPRQDAGRHRRCLALHGRAVL